MVCLLLVFTGYSVGQTIAEEGDIEITGMVTVIVGVPDIEVYTSENWTEVLRTVDFGELGRGQSSELKTLYIANTGTEVAYIEIEVITDISGWGKLWIMPSEELGFSRETYMILPNRYNPYNLQLDINVDAVPSDYSFTLLVRELQ